MAAEATVWERPHATLPPLIGEERADACIVGLGGAGLAAIAAALARGLSVVGVDAGDPGAGAAGRNGGFLIAGLASFHHDAVARFGRARAAALYRATAAELAHLAAAQPGIVRRTGSLRLAVDAQERVDCRAQLDAMRLDGLPVERHDGDEGDGLLFPDDAAYDPLALVRAEADEVRGAGARLFGCSPAQSIAPGRVATARGVVTSRITLVCVDGGLELLLPQLGDAVRSARLQMLATEAVDAQPDRRDPEPGHEGPGPRPGDPEPRHGSGLRFPRPVYARHGYDYWQQLPDGRIALGGARDVGGDDEWTTSRATSAPVQRALDALLRERLGIAAAVTHRWAATVGYTRTGLPLLARIAPGLVACGGYNGTGNLMSRLCGRAALAVALGGRDETASLIGVL